MPPPTATPIPVLPVQYLPKRTEYPYPASTFRVYEDDDDDEEEERYNFEFGRQDSDEEHQRDHDDDQINGQLSDRLDEVCSDHAEAEENQENDGENVEDARQYDDYHRYYPDEAAERQNEETMSHEQENEGESSCDQHYEVQGNGDPDDYDAGGYSDGGQSENYSDGYNDGYSDGGGGSSSNGGNDSD